MSKMNDQDHNTYITDGFLHIRNALDAVCVEQIRNEWRGLWDSIDLNDAPEYVHWRDREDGPRVADRLDPVHQRSAFLRELCELDTLRLPAEQLLGGSVFVLKDKLITKNPGTKGYGAHQDLPYWESAGLSADDVLSVAIAMDDMTPEHGPIELFPNLHKTLLATDESGLDTHPDALREQEPGYAAVMAAGDALFFHSLTPHRSATNRAATPRRIYMITYARDYGNREEVISNYKSELSRVHAVHTR